MAVVRPPAAGARVVLVDDVQTTGATLAACATALRAAGVPMVLAITYTRALSDPRAGRTLGAPHPDERSSMRIAVKGRNVPVTDELREHVVRRFSRMGRQVSELARLEVEVREERNPAIGEAKVAEATLYLKGTTLRARDRARDLRHAVNLCEEELGRQVKRHADKRRKHRKVGTESIRTTPAQARAAARRPRSSGPASASRRALPTPSRGPPRRARTPPRGPRRPPGSGACRCYAGAHGPS